MARAIQLQVGYRQVFSGLLLRLLVHKVVFELADLHLLVARLPRLIELLELVHEASHATLLFIVAIVLVQSRVHLLYLLLNFLAVLLILKQQLIHLIH